MSVTHSPAKYNEILCIGAGLSGVCLGVQLKRKLGFTDIHFYDRNASHSGTWFANRYPGCACDVPAIFYSFSFEMNPHWTRLLPSNIEVQAYIQGVVDKYQLGSRMTFRTECESAKWSSERQVWTVYLRDLESGEKYIHECRLLFSAVGVLVEPSYPRIPGRETFEGAMFHTARWNSEVDLKNKDVIVIGNGCSGTQAVPEITPITKTLTQFIRTPHWLVERPNIKFGPGIQWAFRYIPLLSRLARALVFLYSESGWRMFLLNKRGAKLRRANEKVSTAFILGAAPEKYHDILIPDWEITCKRRVCDPDSVYLKSLHAPHLHLTKDPILEIVPHGVRTARKIYPADVIILATGFQTNNGLGPLCIQGRNGEWLHDHWKKRGGPSAYNSTAVHGYPNFLMIYGPNSTTGHTSVIFAIENMVNYALKIVKPLIKGEASEVEVRSEADNGYCSWVQEASRDKIWNTCSNWYVTNGWNSSLYPRSQIHFWWRSVFPTWSDWSYKYTKSRTRRSELRRIITLLLFVMSIVWVVAIRGDSYLWNRLIDQVLKLMRKGRSRFGV